MKSYYISLPYLKKNAKNIIDDIDPKNIIKKSNYNKTKINNEKYKNVFLVKYNKHKSKIIKKMFEEISKNHKKIKIYYSVYDYILKKYFYIIKKYIEKHSYIVID